MPMAFGAPNIISPGALQVLDVLVAAAVEGPPLAAPPATPVIGKCYIVGTSPSGAWAGHSADLAAYTSGGWRFVAPREGMGVHVASANSTAVYVGGAWVIGSLSGSELVVDGLKVVGVRGAAIADPAGGTTVDAEARAAVAQILAAMRQHGLIEM